MQKLFICTSNYGKQEEIRNFVKLYGSSDIQLFFPSKNDQIHVEETADTYEGNALLKALAYYNYIQDNSMLYIGDDSGLCIPALNNEPGVKSRRWAGHEMTDQEILDYCLLKMAELNDKERTAVFTTVLVALKNPGQYSIYTGELKGSILKKPLSNIPLEGFPFRATFWIEELGVVWQDVLSLSISQRGDFLTNREKAFQKLFADMKNNSF